MGLKYHSKLEDLLFTLEICEKSLPSNAHPVHYERLREIQWIIKTAQGPSVLDRVAGRGVDEEDEPIDEFPQGGLQL